MYRYLWCFLLVLYYLLFWWYETIVFLTQMHKFTVLICVLWNTCVKRRMDSWFLFLKRMELLDVHFSLSLLKALCPQVPFRLRKKICKFTFWAFWWSKIQVKGKMEDWIIYILLHDLEGSMYLQQEIISHIFQVAFALFYMTHLLLVLSGLSSFVKTMKPMNWDIQCTCG